MVSVKATDLRHPPALMKEPHAAAYLGVSVTTLRGLEEGPVARHVGNCKLYLRADLEAWAASLPTDDEREAKDKRTLCDAVFG